MSSNNQKQFLSYFFLPGTIASLAAFATRILTTVLWGNSDSFQEPKQRYEELLKLGGS